MTLLPTRLNICGGSSHSQFKITPMHGGYEDYSLDGNFCSPLVVFSFIFTFYPKL